MLTDVINLILSVLILISATFVLLSAIGIVRFKDNIKRILYARIHILGVADVACIIALITLNEPLLAATYFILSPFASHAIANAYYYGEEKHD
jgi:energy-converting hydrogenase B subunit C